MKKTLLALSVFAAAFAANATPDVTSTEFTKAFVEGAVPDVTPGVTDNHMHPSCEAVKLTPEQKTALKEAFYTFAKEATDIEAALKRGMIDYAYALSTTASTRDQGRESATAINTAVTSGATLATNFGLQVFFDILTPEQKEPAFECALHKMKEKKKKHMKEICDGMGEE